MAVAVPVLAVHKAKVLNAHKVEIWINGMKMHSMSHNHMTKIDGWYSVTGLNSVKIPNDYQTITIDAPLSWK